MDMIKKHRSKLITAVTLAASVSIILFVIALFISIWFEISIFTGFEFASGTINILAGIVVIPGILYFLMKEKNKFWKFCDIYDDPDMRKHAPKIMYYSLIKYLSVIFILIAVLTAPYGLGVLLAPLLVPTCYLTGCMLAYIKLWKYHGYSVRLLLILSVAVIIISVQISPFVRAGLWTAVDAMLRFANIF